jgi:DNA polymerase I-like protein with 3'-5' exonuclease and polymerase domains
VKNIFLLLNRDEDTSYVPFLKPILGGKANVRIRNFVPTSVTEVLISAKELGCNCVATNSPELLQLLLPNERRPLIDNYAGSLIERFGTEFLIIDPLKQQVTVAHAKFILERYFSKFLRPEAWINVPAFTWELFDPKRYTDYIDLFRTATFISCDIETERGHPDRVINCVGFSAVHIDGASKSYRITTVVIPTLDEYHLAVAGTICRLPVPKVFQNGKYDNAYLLRFGIATTNWAFDTKTLFHSWLAELPKDLGFIATFLVRKWQYWKDLSKSSDLQEYYEYNARDCFATAVSLLQLLQELPPYAIKNFQMEFPLLFPSMVAEHTPFVCDRSALKVIEGQLQASAAARLAKIQAMVGIKGFNPRSPQQMVQLLEILGSGDLKSSDAITLDKAMARHPLNKKILGECISYRKDTKLDSTYVDEEKLWHGRIYYSLNPDATDTGRNASKESSYWCGFQIQNIPRDRKDVKIKEMYCSEEGFYLGECDYEQNEARGTAYLSGDEKLIEAVEDITKDFHGKNASDFFGIPYEEIINSYFDSAEGRWIHDVIDKLIRDLSKRTNHGANYNMGEDVMVDTMGIENVLRARKLLKLPMSWSLRQVCKFLLDAYAAKYKIVKGPWYDKCKNDVETTGFLVGPTGYTRRCFGHPAKSKRDLNRYVAHPPQSLAAQLLNRAYMQVYKTIWLPQAKAGGSINFKLMPQIHDSIVFQYRIGFEELAWQVKRCMEMKTPITDTFGKTRELFVPVALKGGDIRWSELKSLKRNA